MEFATMSLIKSDSAIIHAHKVLPKRHACWEYIAKCFANQDEISENRKHVYEIILTHLEWYALNACLNIK